MDIQTISPFIIYWKLLKAYILISHILWVEEYKIGYNTVLLWYCYRENPIDIHSEDLLNEIPLKKKNDKWLGIISSFLNFCCALDISFYVILSSLFVDYTQ